MRSPTPRESGTPRPPVCPRCGYDQSGAIATWRESCPVAGTCSECGLEFAWVNVLCPERDRVRGFFEHTRGPWASLWAIPRTAWLALRPWVFWKRVQLHMRPRLGRAGAWLALFIGVVLLLRLALAASHVLLKSPSVWQRGGGSSSTLVAESIAYEFLPPLNSSPWMGIWRLELPEWWKGWGALVAIATPIWPISFALLPETRRAAKVRRAHIARGFIYSWVWVSLLYLPWLVQYGPWLTTDALDAMGIASPPLVQRVAFSADQIDRFHPEVGRAIGLGAYGWLALWWLCAIRRGFGMEHAWGVWAALLVVNILGALAARCLWEIGHALAVGAL